jgi:hypothetical protein
MLSYRNRIESYKKIGTNPIRRKVNFKLKFIRNTIEIEEAKRDWCQFIIQGIKIGDTETYETFSKIVIKFIFILYTLKIFLVILVIINIKMRY